MYDIFLFPVFSQKHANTFVGNTLAFQSSSTTRHGGNQRLLPSIAPRALLTVKETSTGVEFPLVQKYWYVLCVVGTCIKNAPLS